MNLTPSTATPTSLRVWDLPTRVFHWSLAASVVGLVISAKTGAMDWHFRLGYFTLALLMFRIVWGFVGGHWSRFSAFIYAPSTVLRYLRGEDEATHRVGHSPLGALSVLAMLSVLVAQLLSGLMSDDAITFTGPLAALVPGAWSSAATDWHKDWGQWLVIGLVALHLLAICFYVLIKRRRLIGPMVHGDQDADARWQLPASQDSTKSRLIALALFGLCFALAQWVASFQG